MSEKSHYLELLAQLENLKKEIDAERTVLVRDAIATCQGLIAEYDLSAVDLGLVKTHHAKTMAVKQSDKTFRTRAKRGPQPPKYVNPETGVTWNGNGRAPLWMVGNRDDYLIAELVEKPRATQNNGHAHH